jgi:hypothetical protein
VIDNILSKPSLVKKTELVMKQKQGVSKKKVEAFVDKYYNK